MNKESVKKFIMDNFSNKELNDLISERNIETVIRNKMDIESLNIHNSIFVHEDDYCKTINNCPSDYEGEIFVEVDSSEYGHSEFRKLCDDLINNNFTEVGITVVPNNYEFAKVIENSYEQHLAEDNIIVLEKKDDMYIISAIL